MKAGGLDKLIRTPRDVVRYVNGLAVNGGIVSGEVNPVDLAAIEAIRTFAPELYSFIRDNRDIVVGPTGGSWSVSEPTTREKHRKQLDEAYSLCKPELRTAFREICLQLFPEIETLCGGSAFGNGFYEQWRKAKRICVVDFFPRYFYLRPSDEEVTQAEFEAIVGDAGNHAQLVIRLGELVATGRENLWQPVRSITFLDALAMLRPICLRSILSPRSWRCLTQARSWRPDCCQTISC